MLQRLGGGERGVADIRRWEPGPGPGEPPGRGRGAGDGGRNAEHADRVGGWTLLRGRARWCGSKD